MIRNISIFLCIIILSACGSKTTVILLPEENGKTGSVIVNSKNNSQVLDRAYTYASVTSDSAKILVEETTRDKVNDEYQGLLNATPPKPVSILLYFEHDSRRLTPESQALIPKIFEIAKERSPSEISIIGHTDSKGSSEYNNQLALERAEAVGILLRNPGIALKNLTIKSHGENDPLVGTGDNVSEVKNRRVEIMIR